MTPPVPLILHVFPTFAVGGAQARFATIANAMGSAFRHMVVSLDGRLDARGRVLPSIDISYPELSGRKDAFLGCVLAYRQLLRQWQPDLLVTYNWGAIEFAFANILPLVRHVHVIDGFGSDEYFVRLRRRVMANRMALCRGVTVVPSMNLRRILQDEWALPPDRVQYIPNGIDLMRFSASRPVARADAPLTIGTVAALRPEKNIARLLHAFSRLEAASPVRLTIVGDGECRGELVALAGALGIRDRLDFVGHSNDVHAFLATFDIFALSSDTEQMPIVVLEAMASGIPVVATDVGDIRVMVAAENDAFIGNETIDGFAASLRRLVEDGLLRARIGAANRAKAEARFAEADMLDTWRDLLWDRIRTPLGL